MSVCKLENCNEKHSALGLCLTHYRKYYSNKYKDKKIEYDKQYRIKNKERLDKKQWKYYRETKQYQQEYFRKHFQKNKERIYKRTNEWRRRNPQKVVQYWLNHLNKYSKPFNIESRKFGWMLTQWAKGVREHDNNQCQVCGEINDIQAHHIFHKEEYPKLCLNQNNGVTLCRRHHMESHCRTSAFVHSPTSS